MRATVFVLSVCLAAFGVAGCKKKTQTAPPVAGGPDSGQMPPWQGGPGGPGGGPGGGPPPAPEPYTGPFAAGHNVFVSQGCVRCHRQGGGGGGMPGRGRGPGGPDLSEVGAKHDRDWIAAHVRHAKGHNPRSRMPDYGEDKINDTDMKALADYLTSLKGK
jgi:mono/diheme cytochrome c family protein